MRDFYVAGKGTLAPWDPPKKLVTVGLYRLVRNPMYVGVILILLGWAIVTGSPIVSGFTLFMSSAFYFRVKMHEEPWAERTFAAEWQNYKDLKFRGSKKAKLTQQPIELKRKKAS